MVWRSRWCVRLGLILGAGMPCGYIGVGKSAPAPAPEEEARQLRLEAVQHYEEGNYALAMPLEKRACLILEKNVKVSSEGLVTCLNNLALMYAAQGQYGEAEPLLERALTIQERGLGHEHAEVALSLNNLAGLYQAQGKYGKAEPLLERALAIREKALGPKHSEVALSLNNLAGLYQAQGKYRKAEPLYKRALAIQQKALSPRHPDIASSVNNLATLYQAQGEYRKAAPLYERALAIREKALGPQHPDVAQSLNNLAALLHAQGEYRGAESLYERALAIEEKKLGAQHVEVASSLNNLAALYNDQGKYERAKPLYERALAIWEKALGPAHPQVASSLNNLAALHWTQGEYEKAAPLVERALAIREKVLGPEHPQVASSLNNLAALYDVQGEYGKAEALYERALATWEKVLGPEHPSLASGLHNLAELCRTKGEYSKAETLYERALATREKALGPEHPDVALSLNSLALLYMKQGKLVMAEPLYERALAIRTKTLGTQHPDVANSLHDLAILHKEQGDYDKAEPLYERALAIWEMVLGPEHPDVATGFNNLAVLYKEQGDYGKAESLYKRALSIQEKALGPEHLDVANSLNNLAVLYKIQGEHEKAMQLTDRARRIAERVLGPDNIVLAKILDNLGTLHLLLGQYDLAITLQRRSLTIEHEHLGRTLLFTEDNRRLEHADMTSSVDAALSAHMRLAPDHHALAALALTTVLSRKGLVLDLGARSEAIIRHSLPEDQRHLLDELSVTRDRYAALGNRGPGPRSIERFAEQFEELQREQRRLWRQIAEISPFVGTFSKLIEIDGIQRALPADAVLLEIVRYRPRFDDTGRWSPRTGPLRYAGYLVFRDRFDWVDLGPSEPIEQQIEAFRTALQLRHAVPTDLHETVMQPILDRLGDARRLFIAPDADLNLIPFGALYDGERYLIERYDLHYLTTGRDLLRPWDAYGSTNDDTVMVVANPTGASLPGTEQEAELLEDLFPHVETLLRDTATEAGAQRRAQPWVLHLAMHGFFEIPAPDLKLEARMDEYVLSMSPSSLPFAPGPLDNPMLYSGLVLASADTPADTTTDTDDEHVTADGRLTAYEVSGWDLRGTQLIVLSACGSGLGEPRAGEGVLGLRRAFAMAGAQTQVMSLWDVSDATTAKLMEAYYRKLLAGKGRAEAMQEVQLEMLRSGEHHPGDWASFVVVGEWRPLSKARLPAPEGPPLVESGGCGCQRASVGGDDPQLPMLLLGFLGFLGRRRKTPTEGA